MGNLQKSAEPEPQQLLERDEWVAAVKSTPEARIGLRKHGQPVGKALDLPGIPEKHAFPWVMSTSSQDRDKDVVTVTGWTWKNVMQTGEGPVLLAHNRYTVPIAKMIAVRTDGGALMSNVIFPTVDEAPHADMSHWTREMVAFGALSFGSVGFLPEEWTFDEALGGVRFLRQELLEFSLCPVPSNPEAVIRAKSAGISFAPVRAWAAEVIDITDKADAAFASIEKLWKASKAPQIYVQSKGGVLVPLERFAKDEGSAEEPAEVEAVAEAAPPAAPVAVATEPAPAEVLPEPEPQPLEVIAASFGVTAEKFLTIVAEERAALQDQLYISLKTPLTGQVPA